MGFLKKLFRGAEPATDPAEKRAAHTLTIRQAVEQVSARPSEHTRRALYQSLNHGNLLVAVQSLPEGVGTEARTLTQDLPVKMLTSTGPEGGVVLLAFTDEAALHERAPGSPYLVLSARAVLDIVLRDGYAGLIINPAGSWAGVPREDIQRIVDGVYT
ncbi:MAG TPA: SseB family protein [Herpetosiphonaceae bacterium]